MSRLLAQPLIDPHLLTQLEQVAFVSRRTFRGRVKGDRKSPHKGSSAEFSDYRPYEVGDDLRYVDWNIFGRLDRLYLKLFVDEEDFCVHLLVDGSASMDYGDPNKFQYARQLAAALAFVGLVNHERVGVAVLRDRVNEGRSPSRGRAQFLPLMEFLSSITPNGRTALNVSLKQYSRQAKESGLAILISDLLDPQSYETGLSALREKKYDLHLIHLLSPQEMSPEGGGDVRLVDAESGEIQELTLDAEALRHYHQKLQTFLDHAEQHCLASEISYHRVVTDTPLEDLMLRKLKGSLLQ
jgi:uncharacterized protein (DUF58 family)